MLDTSPNSDGIFEFFFQTIGDFFSRFGDWLSDNPIAYGIAFVVIAVLLGMFLKGRG